MITIVFSRDRALQCDALLRSIYLNCNENLNIHVLYTYSNERHKNSYKNLEKFHKNVKFIKEIDFKSDLLRLIHNKIYILFLTDDTIFIRNFSIKDAIYQLDNNIASIGFSFRLGLNTTNCYTVNHSQKIPQYICINSDMMMYNWTNAEYDYGYPLELSSSLYKSRDILPILNNLSYNNPNELEWMMYCSLNAYKMYKPLLLCYNKSVAFSIPLNKVQLVNNNRNSGIEKYSSNSLLTFYEKCGMIDIDILQGFVPNGAHQELEIKIVQS